jgi:hypothetical protein
VQHHSSSAIKLAGVSECWGAVRLAMDCLFDVAAAAGGSMVLQQGEAVRPAGRWQQ